MGLNSDMLLLLYMQQQPSFSHCKLLLQLRYLEIVKVRIIKDYNNLFLFGLNELYCHQDGYRAAGTGGGALLPPKKLFQNHKRGQVYLQWQPKSFLPSVDPGIMSANLICIDSFVLLKVPNFSIQKGLRRVILRGQNYYLSRMKQKLSKTKIFVNN